MMYVKTEFFPQRPDSNPRIYAYEDLNPMYKGLLKIGFTTIDVEQRVAQQYPTKRPGPLPYKIQLNESAIRDDGTSFTDRTIHEYLLKKGFENPEGEWFKCTVDDVKAAVIALQKGVTNVENRTQRFSMRPEQEEAVKKTINYYKIYKKENPDKIPRFLWNAKMRFGKTFASYQLAKRMEFKKILVLTFKPAVQSAWEDDLSTHIDFEGWQFISRGKKTYEEVDKSRPFVCFASFQDFLGKSENGGIKLKNKWAHKEKWDLTIFDEYHYGAWREKAKELFASEETTEQKFLNGEGMDLFKEGFNEELVPIHTSYYLYLSGTPFRAIASGEFIEEQIYNWTYLDEQKAKEKWVGENNPYDILPRMVLMTYRLPKAVTEIAFDKEFNEFDLDEFFSADAKGDKTYFKHENEVQKWLDIIRGKLSASSIDDLKIGATLSMPFSNIKLLNVLNHTFWFLPSINSCYAMHDLLKQDQNNYYRSNYKVIVAAGQQAGIGVEALKKVREAMTNPLHCRTITLSCGKLTTGVTIEPWTGIFMLRNLKSPETYFQAAFRVQSPWVIDNDLSPTKYDVMKKECYIFDFAPNRALKQIADYSCRLNIDESSPEKKVEELINFLPVLAFEGTSMKPITAAGVLEFAVSGTSATLLAKCWESALLVNVDNNTLARLMANEAAMKALMNIEGFRSLNNDIELIINESDLVKNMKTRERRLNHKEKKKMTEKEREYMSKRKIIQEKLIKLATRIPIFMYLTDFREHCLKNVITQLESSLFKKVTGLEIEDFELLVKLGVFNKDLMNEAVYNFKRYEDPSLSYTGINRHGDQPIGLYDRVIRRTEKINNFIKPFS